jgi:hypothetical protein
MSKCQDALCRSRFVQTGAEGQGLIAPALPCFFKFLNHGKFAFQPERVIGPPSCDTLHFPSKTMSLA